MLMCMVDIRYMWVKPTLIHVWIRITQIKCYIPFLFLIFFIKTFMLGITM